MCVSYENIVGYVWKCMRKEMGLKILVKIYEKDMRFKNIDEKIYEKDEMKILIEIYMRKDEIKNLMVSNMEIS